MTETSGVGVMIRSLANGGAEKQSILLAKALQERYQTFLIILDDQPQHPKHRQKIKEENIQAIFLSGHMLQKLKQLTRLVRRHHLQHLFCFLPSDTLMATLAARLSGISPIVYGGIRNDQIPWRKKAALKLLHNHSLDYSISNCHSGVKNMIREGFNGSKFIVIHNALEEMPSFSPPEEKEEVRIVTVGRFVAQKGYDRALRIMQMLREQDLNFRYTIMGYGALEAEIRQTIEQLGLVSRVDMIINPDNVLEHLSRSDIYLCTSSFEGLSNAVMEAMSCQLPVVATEVGDNDYLVIPQKNGYLHAVEDVAGMAESLIRLIRDPQLRSAYGAESQSIIRERFTFEAFQQNYFRLLDSEAVTT